jgi:DNA-binding NarL/FixJ family response regulator
MQNTRVLVAAGRALFRQGLAALIGAAVGFAVVGEAADADEARRLAVRERPELIVLDTELPCVDGGCDLIACLRAVCERSAIVVLGEADRAANSEEEGESALRAEREHALLQGATAYLPARADAGELLRLLTTLAATLACAVAEPGAQAEGGTQARQAAVNGSGRITEREQTIIVLIAQGLCNKEVAHRLGISTQTVKNHVSRLLEKLALADRTQLAVYAVEHKFEF